MAKVSIKSEKITPFGGIFHVRELFSRFVAPIIDKVIMGISKTKPRMRHLINVKKPHFLCLEA